MSLVGLVTRLLRWLPESWRAIDADREGGADAPPRFGFWEIGLLIVSAVGLAVTWYPGSEQTFLDWWADTLTPEYIEPDPYGYLPHPLARAHPYYELFKNLQWSAACVVGYAIIPLLYVKLTRRSLRLCNVGWRGTADHWRVYAAFLIPVLTAVAIVSFTDDYQQIYPFYKDANRSWMDLILWELAYGAQFFALEFFFRGFMVGGLHRAFGHGAIFVMVVPYCMIHFGKTFSESMAAIVAGTVLGTMSLRYKSIWGGAFVHWIVAISMDVASLVQQNAFPDKWTP